MENEKDTLMEKITSLAKRRGFIFQGSEIYGGLAGTYDYGPLGVALKNNIKNSWWKKFVENREDMYGVDAAILMNANVWRATGHIDNFSDPMVECKKCKKRFRADQIPRTVIKDESQKDHPLECPECEGELGEEKKFNMMFATQIGAVEDSSS
ncbi:glycine--tRNA ligase, partial [Candidatus Nomurabacteria bacterium]|nr:glycine--tRNA ligase [Candidatus Nomurabacteria bacterium]